MSATTFYGTQPSNRVSHGRFAFQTVADWIRRRIAIERTRRILRALPDYMLEDIGIGRSQIDDVVAGSLNHAGKARGPYPF
jgi:uncharacterized protein YjiS (DUF1127 family)